MTRRLIVAVLLLGLLSPVSAYPHQHVGPLNLPETEKNGIIKAVKVKLTEPWSGEFRFSQHDEDPYTYCGLGNAKNKVGDYTEIFPFWVMRLRNGVGFISISEDSRSAKNVIAVCQNTGYFNVK